MDGPPIDNGALLIEGSLIKDVGTFREIKARNKGDVLDLGEQILLPGLINAHCHLDYTRLRGTIPRQDSFTNWIRAINAKKAELSSQDYLVAIEEGFAEAKHFGTTTIANLTAFPELIRQIRAPIRTWWFAELIDVRDPNNGEAIVDRALEFLEAAKNRGLAPHALYTASARLYRYAAEVAWRENLLLTTHLAESREEMQMFLESAGPLEDFLCSIGRDMSDLNSITPVQHALAFCSFDERWLLVHLNEILDSDLELLARLKTKPHIVHCPRSHKYFGHSRFHLQRLRELGFNICLGTDSLASNDDLSLFAEMRELQRSERALSPVEILEMATINPATALGSQGNLGRVSSGCLADLIAIPISGPGDPLDQIIGYEEPLFWRMINGSTDES
jgi:cytosine/adenosine deaminase-related metal-dependent hydrolase